MFLLFYLLYRNCHELRFCSDNINKSHPVLSIDRNQTTFDGFDYKSQIFVDGVATENYLVIYKIKNSGFRFRIERSEEMSSYRFDITFDDMIVYKDKISTKEKLIIEKQQFFDILETEDHVLNVNIAPYPLSVSFGRDKKLYISINDDNFLFFENGEPLEDTEWITNTFFEEAHYQTETYPHGKTAVGVDISFLSPGSRLTGFSEGTYPVNLEDTNGEPERRYSRDSYSMYGFVPMMTAHCADFGEIQPTILYLNPSDMFLQIKTKSTSRVAELVSEGGFIDIIVFIDKIPNILLQYSYLTGYAPLPPRFAFGYHQSKYGYKNQSEVENILDELDAVNFPHDFLWLDIDHLYKNQPLRIDTEKWFYDPQKLYKKQSDKNRYVVRITDPHMPIDEEHKQYVEGHALGYFIKDKDGKEVKANCWPGNSTWPDFFRKEVREWWGKQFAYDADPVGWAKNVWSWNDMNEIAVFDSIEGTAKKDWLHYGGKYEDREVHSAYGLMMTAATYNGLLERDNNELRPFILTRSFFAGSQKFTWHWSGDNNPSWEHLQYSIDLIISAGLNGLPFSGSDIGGFTSNTTDELHTRWFQVAAYIYPFCRQHAGSNSLYREPYLYKDSNPAVFNAMLSSIQERYKLLPLWYTASYHYTQTAEPLITPLWYDYPKNEEIHDVRFQVLLDHKLMICPVVYNGSTEVNITKPDGRWYSFSTGKELLSSERVSATLAEIPIFIKGGTIIPYFTESKTNVKDQFTQNIQLVVAVDENEYAKGDLYLDDGETLKYEKEHIYAEFEFVNKTFIYKVNGSCPNVTNKISSIKIYGIKDSSIVYNNCNMQYDEEYNVYLFDQMSLDVKRGFTMENQYSINENIPAPNVDSSFPIWAIVVIVVVIALILAVSGFLLYKFVIKKCIAKRNIESEGVKEEMIP